METRKCSTCNNFFPATDVYFGNQKGGKYGLRKQCRPCRSESKKKYKEDNRESYLVSRKIEHQKSKESDAIYAKQYNHDNAEAIAEQRKKHREENPEIIRNRASVYYMKNRDRELARSNKYRLENPDKARQSNKAYSIKNKDAISKRGKVYRGENKDKISKRNRDRRILNIDKMRARERKYQKDHPEQRRLIVHNRNARIKLLPHTFTIVQWRLAKEHFKNKCAFCDEEVPLTMEHFIATDNGGEFTKENIIPSCQSCNSSKGAREPIEWFREQVAYAECKETKILDYLGYKNGIQQLSIMQINKVRQQYEHQSKTNRTTRSPREFATTGYTG